LGPRVGAAAGAERCTGDAKLGDDGDEGNEPSSLEPRVGAAVGVERCTYVSHTHLTMATTAQGDHPWGGVWEPR
jgi:hypothetical protein